MNKKDYEKLFCRKMSIVLSQLMRRSYYKVGPDFFMITVADGVDRTKNGIHESGTKFKFVSLLDIFDIELKELLTRLNISITRKKDETIFLKN